MDKKQDFHRRVRSGQIRRQDVRRMLAELACGKVNDCVRLALQEAPELDKLDLRLLAGVKRSDNGTVEVRLIDRLQILQQLAQVAAEEDSAMEGFLKALQEEKPC